MSGKKILWMGKTGDANSWYHIYPFGAAQNTAQIEIVRNAPSLREVPKERYRLFEKGSTPVEMARMFIAGVRACLADRPNLIVTFNPLPWGVVAWAVAKVFRVPVLVGHIGAELDPGRTGILGRALVWVVARNSSVVTVAGTKFIEEMVGHGIKRERLRVFPHCVSDHWLSMENRPDADYDLITMASLLPVKRLDLLIRMVKAAHDRKYRVSLCILGAGPDRPALEDLITELGLLDHVHLMGHQKDVTSFMLNSRMFIQTSRNEGLSIALIEAMATGLVPVVTSAGAEADIIIHGQNGFLVDVDDLSAMTDHIIQMMNPVEYMRVRQNLLDTRYRLGMPTATRACEEMIETFAR